MGWSLNRFSQCRLRQSFFRKRSTYPMLLTTGRLSRCCLPSNVAGDQNEHMKGGYMEDEHIKDECMKDEYMKEESMKDEHMTDEHIKDEPMKDENT